MFPIDTNRNRMINKKAFPLPSVLARNKIYLGIYLKEELPNLFGKLPSGIPYSHRGGADRNFSISLKKNISPIQELV